MNEMEVLRLKCNIVGGMMWAAQKVLWGSEWAYDRLGEIRTDLMQQYYAEEIKKRYTQDV